jgi:poly(ribitol-phosphate) beta-N-acetylglucosaminyltransferase
MPYLKECLRSLIGQTIGLPRLEIVAVDDGSTDGSGEELDRWAAKYPDTIKVLHQENSGGPAGPSNRALDIATGRYVFFVGADDHLGLEALERLVTAADDLDADIVLGKLVGAGGRVVNQGVFNPGDRDDITLVNSALPWALSNTKLYRRSMLEEHHIRYPVELRSGSDQPFTLRAIGVARRIAVRADYEFYYAVRRKDSSNITYRTSLHNFVQDAAIVMDTAADVLTDPAARARVLRRHFTWELGKLLDARFLKADADEQRRGDRYYIGYPGFQDPASGQPDDWFDATRQVRQLAHQTGPAKVSWGRDSRGRKALLVGWHSSLPDLRRDDEPAPRVLAGDRVAPYTESGNDDKGGTGFLAEFAVDDLVAGEQRSKRHKVRFIWTLQGESHGLPVTTDTLRHAPRILHRRGLRFYLVGPALDEEKHLRVVVNPLTPRRIAGRLVRPLRRKR